MNNEKDTFGKRFKHLRTELELTQSELVKLFNKKYYYSFNTSSISMYENNKQIPEIDVLNKWADFFNCSLDYLVGRVNTKKSHVNNEESEKNVPKKNSLFEDIEDLSEESQKELEKYIELLKIKDKMDKGKDETLSALDRNA